MRLWDQFKSSNFGIRLTHWEYWPFAVIYGPAFLYWLYLSLKARSLFFFSAANPGIETGGLAGESKIRILNLLPKDLIPKTVFVPLGSSFAEIGEKVVKSGIEFPVIVKPNIGSRGFLVTKIANESELETFLQEQNVDFLIQEFVDLPEEISILYYRFPNESQGVISSVTIKKLLTVRGDGYSSILELIKSMDRAKLQLASLQESHANLDYVPAEGETVELVPFGNHCRGAAFYNGNHLIDQKLVNIFNSISHQLQGIYFGRYDIKCRDFASLRNGNEFKILEINGVGAEPAHIYDPDYSLFRAFKDIHQQWNIIYRIGQFNRRNGTKTMTFKDGYRMLVHVFTYKKLAQG
ncbi:MAG: D-alanine--D-alanine ligase [Cyclobacteriaceae bacterium]|nr:MAG: D-alanine--D-alanine ligase [Cyclobacteriaceae bacterium]